MNLYYESDALQHHGIKGMKWGVRRYQNKDGSYTPAGRKRYYSVIESKLRGEKAAVDARRDTYRKLNASPKKHTRLQYEVAATASSYKARKETARKDSEANRQMRAEKKAQKKAFRDDVKEARKKGLAGDYEIDVATGQMKITQFYNSKGEKIGREYAQKVMKQASRANTISTLAKTAAVISGAAYVDHLIRGN